MPHRVLSSYLQQVETAISQCRDAYVERYVEEILTPDRANLRLWIRFASGRLLEINEAVVVVENQLTFLDYRYHFRYDSTPNFPDLPTFPHHKHLPDTVIASNKPDLGKVLQEAVGP